jgi:hypothetical protein
MFENIYTTCDSSYLHIKFNNYKNKIFSSFTLISLKCDEIFNSVIILLTELLLTGVENLLFIENCYKIVKRLFNNLMFNNVIEYLVMIDLVDLNPEIIKIHLECFADLVDKISD